MRERARLTALALCLALPAGSAAGEPVGPHSPTVDPRQRAGEALAEREAILTNQAAMARITTRWRARELYRLVRAGDHVRISDADRARALAAGAHALAREQQEQRLLAAERDQTRADRAALVDAAAAGPGAGTPPRFVPPALGPRRSRFGAARDPETGAWFFRAGVRIGARPGEPVRAAAAGVVRRVTPASAQGPAILIDHGGGWVSVLAELGSGTIVVRDGERVAAGRVVARAGAAAGGTAFELWRGATPVDPAAYIHFSK